MSKIVIKTVIQKLSKFNISPCVKYSATVYTNTNTNTNTFILEIYTYIHEIFWKYIHDMAMKRKFMMYAPGNRNYGYCRLHFGYQIMIYTYIYNITDRNFEINVD